MGKCCRTFMNKTEKEEQDKYMVLGWEEPAENKNFYKKRENMLTDVFFFFKKKETEDIGKEVVERKKWKDYSINFYPFMKNFINIAIVEIYLW